VCESPFVLFHLQRPSPLPLPQLLSFSLCPRRSPSFLFHPHRLLSALSTPSISEIMTPVLDCIETAVDRIKHDEFLADKKRVMSFFGFLSLMLLHPITPLTYATSSNRSNSAKPRPLDCPLIPRDTLIHAPILAMFPLYLSRLPRPFLFLFLLIMSHFRLLAPFLRCHN